jgi:signal transduction histidine kinase
MQPILQFAHLYQRFGTLEVLHDLNFEVCPGEVVGLAGLSGAGKSVIARLLAGLYHPTAGNVFIGGKSPRSPSTAQRLGIEVIHQYPVLVEGLDIISNIFLGSEIYWPLIGKLLRIPRHSRMYAAAARIFQDLGVEFDSLEQNVLNITAEQRQLVALARAIVRSPQVIMIDDPTMLLSYTYQQKLLLLIQRWHQPGKTIIFSSNNLDHLFAITDRILVLREGRLVANHLTDKTSREQIVAAMVGQTHHEQITPVIWALDSYYRAREKADQLYHHTNLLEKDLVAQGTLNQELLTQLTHQVKALDQANTALQDAHRRLLTEREQERKHVARELHDQAIQDLLSTNYELEEIASRYHDEPELQRDLANVRDVIRHTIDDVRQICGNLRPPTIDSLGLVAAIQSYTRLWSKRTGIDVKLHLSRSIGRLPEATELSIFRIIQEGLQNVYRHSEATIVELSLRHTSPRTLMISILDNGRGLETDFDLGKLSSNGHYGLLGISERVALLSGHLRLQNHQHGGVMLQVEIPHPRVNVEFVSDSLRADETPA